MARRAPRRRRGPRPGAGVGRGRDEIVPPHLSRRVHEAAREPKRLAEISAEDHNDPALLDGRELLAEIDTFLDEWVRRER